MQALWLQKIILQVAALIWWQDMPGGKRVLHLSGRHLPFGNPAAAGPPQPPGPPPAATVLLPPCSGAQQTAETEV